MRQEITVDGKVFISCEKHTTEEYIVFFRKVPIEEQVEKRKKSLEKGHFSIIEFECPICSWEMYSQCFTLKSRK